MDGGDWRRDGGRKRRQRKWKGSKPHSWYRDWRKGRLFTVEFFVLAERRSGVCGYILHFRSFPHYGAALWTAFYSPSQSCTHNTWHNSYIQEKEKDTKTTTDTSK